MVKTSALRSIVPAVVLSFLTGLSLQSQPVVGVDNWFNREVKKDTGKPFHYLWTDREFSGYSEWGELFTARGASLTTVLKPDRKALSGLDIYIIPDPDTTSENPAPNYIMPEDVRTISEWVRDGGVLAILANDAPNCEFTHLNTLAAEFGFRFNHVTLHPVPGDDFEMGASTNLPDHPLFRDVKKIYIKEVSDIIISGTAKAILTEKGKVLIAENRVGKGYVFVIGDPWIYNEYIDHARLPLSFDNHKAAENLTGLLLGECREKRGSAAEAKVELMNAPVLFTEGGRKMQQVYLECTVPADGHIEVKRSGKTVLQSALIKGQNRLLITVPAVKGPVETVFSVKINDGPASKYPLTIVPPRKWEIYFVQHSHTDIGYTRPQSEILAEHMRYIDYALDYCDQTDRLPEDAKFRWTCESAWVTREYLHSRPSSQVARLMKRIADGRIEVAGMYCNMAEISDENVMFDFLQPLREFEKQGIPVRTAMQNDVNGIAWCMPDYFKNTGIRYLVMGINETRSVLPFNKPTAFWWEAPSGEKLLAFRADHYMTGNFFGLETTSIKAENMLGHLALLDKKGYPFDRIGIQFSGYFTDNAPPSTAACDLVIKWNEKYDCPKLRLATAGEFPGYIEKNYASSLPVYRSAWLDWWTDGYGSTSRETAEVRKNQNNLQVDQGLFAMVSMMGGELGTTLGSDMDHISENEIFFDEHTCGAAESIELPYSENSTRQWLQKGAYAWEAVKKTTLLSEEALARFQPFLDKASFPVIYVMNSMGWKRTGHVNLFIDYEVLPVTRKARIIDLGTGAEIPAQIVSKRAEGAWWVLEVNNIPALGYKALKIELYDAEPVKEAAGSVEVLENSYYRITVNRKTGAISSLFDKELDQELADSQNPYNIGQVIRETSEKRDLPPFTRVSVSNVRVGEGVDGSIWQSVKISADLPGCEAGQEDLPKGIELELRLYRNVKKVEFRYMARKLIITDPEALYVAFPLSLPGSRIVFETIGGILSQGQQLPGSSTDWNAAQNFVAVRGAKGQVVVVSNEVPLWQFSDFNMAKWEREPKRGRTWLYSYVMNNYWMTNFRAFQEGAFSWSYQLTSSPDTTNTFATLYAWNERNPFPTRTFPAGTGEIKTTSLETLKLTGPGSALLVNSRPDPVKPGAILLHFRELEGLNAEVNITSMVPGRVIKNITEVTATGKVTGSPLKSVQLKPYEVRFVRVDF